MNASTPERSIQTRCPNLSMHYAISPLPFPCSDCYSIIVTTERVPWREPEPWVRVEEPAGEPCGDETEALREAYRVACEVASDIKRERDEALARVAGLEAREEALRDALEEIANMYLNSLPYGHAASGALSDVAMIARAALADSGEAGS